jgi:hypothetical protein
MSRLLSSDIISAQPEILKTHLSICVDFILGQLVGVTAVLLYGGYGRGEGTWLREEGECRPYNDYDFLVILDGHGSQTERKLKTLDTKQLALSLGISWVDIDIISIDAFGRLKGTVKNYDILHGSTVIYGDSRIMEQANSILPHHITSRDLYRYYYTRSYTVLCALPKGKKMEEANCQEMRFFRNQLAKGLLAVQDCELISEYKFYTSSYVERTQFYAGRSESVEKIELYRWALKEKLDPCNNEFDLDFGNKAYKALIDFYQTDMNKYLSKYFYGINVSLKNFQLLEHIRPILLAKFILSNVSSSHKHFKKERVLEHLRYILINTFPGAASSEPFEQWLPKVNKLIASIDPSISHDVTWEYVQNLVMDLH